MKTNKINKVLIALDYNPTAQKVAEAGFSMAKYMNAEVVLLNVIKDPVFYSGFSMVISFYAVVLLLHVITDPVFYSTAVYSPIMGFSGYGIIGPVQLESVDGLKKASLQYLDKSRHHLGDKAIKTLVKEGDFADSILETAKELQADIIVMGSHSHRWMEEILMGSVTEKVLRHTTIPLFIVPTKKNN